jgi:hypothetical protein
MLGSKKKREISVARIHVHPVGRSILFLTISILSAIFVTNSKPAWFFTGKGQIDPWLYWGTGEVFDYTAEHFHLTYYFRRWTLTFPNLIIQNSLPPFEAQFVLRHAILIAVLFLSASLVFILSSSFAASLFAILAISSSTYFISPIGQTYHEGTGLVLFLGLALLVSRVIATAVVPKVLVVLTGVVFGLLLVTYQYGIFWFFSMAISALAIWGSKWIDKLKQLFFPFLAGFVAVDAIDFAIGSFFGYWPELVSYTLLTGEGIRGSGSFAPDIENFVTNFLWNENNFIFPLLVFGFLGLSGKSVHARWFSFFMLTLGGTYLLLPFFGIYGPEILHTAIYGMIITLIGALSAVSRAFDSVVNQSLPKIVSESLKLGIFLVCYSLATYSESSTWLTLVSVAVLGLSLIYIRRKLMPKLKQSIFGPGLTLLSVSALTVAFLAQGLPYYSYSSFSQAEREQQILTAKHKISSLSSEVRTLSAFALENRFRIFILDNRPHEGWSETISAFYGMYSSISEGYPAPPVDCNRLAYSVSMENPRFILMHQGDPSVSREFMEKYLAPCFLYIPVLEGEVPGVDASVFRLEAKLGP